MIFTTILVTADRIGGHLRGIVVAEGSQGHGVAGPRGQQIVDVLAHLVISAHVAPGLQMRPSIIGTGTVEIAVGSCMLSAACGIVVIVVVLTAEGLVAFHLLPARGGPQHRVSPRGFFAALGRTSLLLGRQPASPQQSLRHLEPTAIPNVVTRPFV
jgi:hypothetical protein